LNASHTTWNEAVLRAIVIGPLAEKLGMQPDAFDSAKSFDEYGLDSIDTVLVAEAIASRLGVTLSPEFLFEHRTVDAVVRELMSLRSETQPS
jgi:acyl carrier protein